jgi:uncharacterized protein
LPVDLASNLIQPARDGIVITVRVIPRAGRSGLAGTRDGAVLVRLAAAPVDGAANAALIDLIAEVLRVPKRAVTIVAGDRRRTKKVHVAGVSVEAAARALHDGQVAPGSRAR